MPYRSFLSRIQQMFGSQPDGHFKCIEDGFKAGKLKLPAQPMSDQELAAAIREFQSHPVSDTTLQRLGDRLVEGG
jgi:hypothetical protein